MRNSSITKFVALASAIGIGASALVTPTVAVAVVPANLPPANPGTQFCYPTGMAADVSLGDPKVALGAVGQYDRSACDSRYAKVLANNAKQNGKLPKVKRSTAKFVGIGSTYFSMHDDLYGWNVSETPRKLGSTVTRTCSPAGAWDAFQAKAVAQDASYDPSKPPKYVVNQCSNGTYINDLAYGSNGLFTGKQKNKLLRALPSQAKVKGVEQTVLTWTRGYLLLKYGNKCTDCGKPGSREYRVVIDAGSSGTKLSLYRVQYKPNGYPKITWKRTLKRDGAENGIDDYANPDVAARPGTGNVNVDVIDPLLELLNDGYFAKRKPLAKTKIKVDLLATAGMREAQAKWGTTAVNTMYAGIRTNLNDPGAPFNVELRALSSGSKYSAGLVRTINGNTQEGVWTWVDLNDYYCNYFKNPNGKRKRGCRGAKSGNVGVLEVGGASAQVSFPVKAKSAKGHKYVHQVTLNGRNLRIYNKTFLGLGQDSSRRAMVQL
ncbi:MAG: hypothetical protein WC054_13715 [Candidatus Nanopelagicales bacterium]